MAQDDRNSRRTFLKGSMALAAAGAASVRAAKKNPGGGTLAYAGSYSSPQGPEGSKGRGAGIYLFEMNPSTGGLAQRELVPNDSNPSWLAFNPAKTHLYSGNETGTYEGAASGSVSAYRVDPVGGHLALLNTVSSRGAGPAQLSVHPSGKFVLVANYAGGTVAVLAIREDGSLGEATDVKHDSGVVGPAKASSAPPGSFAISGHDRPHAHMIHSDPSGRFVLATDLGMDRIFVWRFDAANGKLLDSGQGPAVLPPGDGPRHFCFHPNGRWMYSLQEEGSTLVLFDFDPASGALVARQTISTLPKGFAGTSFTSEVALSPDARFVYAANRLHDTIAWFSVGSTGTLTFAGEEWTRGDYPRSFSIDPSGNFLYSCNQRSDVIATFRIHRETGRLTFTWQYTPVGTPAILVFR